MTLDTIVKGGGNAAAGGGFDDDGSGGFRLNHVDAIIRFTTPCWRRHSRLYNVGSN